MKKIVLVRCTDIDPDPRVQKYIDYFNKNQIDYCILAWDRMGKGLCDTEQIKYFREIADYGAGKKNLLKKLKWMYFVFSNLKKEVKNIRVVHACDFDAALPAILAMGRKVEVFFDIFDWIEKGQSKISRLMNSLQIWCAKKANCVIVCEEYRKKQLGFARENLLVLPNIPSFENKQIFSAETNATAKLKLSYVGVFDSNRGLEDLLECVSQNENVELSIAGYGKLRELVERYANCPNIDYRGAVDYSECLEMQRKAELIVALYYTEHCPAHKFAAPNKYYEALFVGKALFTNEGTMLAEKVKKFNTGVVIPEGKEGIESALKKYADNRDGLKEYGENALALWKTKYENYIESFMENEYMKMINKGI